MTPTRARHSPATCKHPIRWESFDYYVPLQRIKRYTEDNYREKITLGVAASVAGMEETYFSTFFHRKTGVRFVEWLHHVRIERAMSLLSRTDQRITDVAYEVGFCDLRTFQRAFKKETNLTPRDFKRICKPV